MKKLFIISSVLLLMIGVWVQPIFLPTPPGEGFELVRHDSHLNLWRYGENGAAMYVAEFKKEPDSLLRAKISVFDFDNYTEMKKGSGVIIFNDVIQWNLARMATMNHDFDSTR